MRKMCADWLCAEQLSKYNSQKNLPKASPKGRLSPAPGLGSWAARNSMGGSWDSEWTSLGLREAISYALSTT